MKKPPKFIPKKGQVDFTNVRWCPVINCVVRYRGKILLVQRSDSLKTYPDYWNGISGYLDDQKSLIDKVREELGEELSLPSSSIKRITLGQIFLQESPKYKKTWIVHPVLVDVTTSKVTLDWEAKAYRWVTPREAKKLPIMPGFVEVLARVGVGKK